MQPLHVVGIDVDDKVAAVVGDDRHVGVLLTEQPAVLGDQVRPGPPGWPDPLDVRPREVAHDRKQLVQARDLAVRGARWAEVNRAQPQFPSRVDVRAVLRDEERVGECQGGLRLGDRRAEHGDSGFPGADLAGQRDPPRNGLEELPDAERVEDRVVLLLDQRQLEGIHGHLEIGEQPEQHPRRTQRGDLPQGLHRARSRNIVGLEGVAEVEQHEPHVILLAWFSGAATAASAIPRSRSRGRARCPAPPPWR